MIYHVYTFTSNRPWERIIVIGRQCGGCFLFLLLLDYRYICLALYVSLDQKKIDVVKYLLYCVLIYIHFPIYAKRHKNDDIILVLLVC